MTPALLLEKLRARFVLKSMKIIKEEEITHMTKEQLNTERKPEVIELDTETLQLVKLRLAFLFFCHFFSVLIFSTFDWFATFFLRICAVIKKWVERHWYDFEVPEMFTSLTDLVALMKEMKLDGIAIQITNTYTRHVSFFPPYCRRKARSYGLFFLLLFFLLAVCRRRNLKRGPQILSLLWETPALTASILKRFTRRKWPIT